MKIEKDDDLCELGRLWREQPIAVPPSPNLLRRVRSQERYLKLGLLAEWGAAIVLCAVGLSFILRDSSLTNLIWGLVTIALVVWALAFSHLNRRQLWRPADESALAHINLALQRLEKKRHAVQFTWILFGVELCIFACWDLLAVIGWWEPMLWTAPLRALYWLGGISLVLAFWSLFVLLRAKREADILEQLRQEIN